MSEVTYGNKVVYSKDGCLCETKDSSGIKCGNKPETCQIDNVVKKCNQIETGILGYMWAKRLQNNPILKDLKQKHFQGEI